MNVGKVLLTTSNNHLSTYNDERDEFVIPVDNGILTCKFDFDLCNNIVESKSLFTSVNVNIASAKLLNSWRHGSEHDFVIINPDSIQKIGGSKLTLYKYQPTYVPILGSCCVGGFVVTVTSKSYTICRLEDNTQQTRELKDIKKCTAITAGWHKDTNVEDKSIDLLQTLICDGNNVYYCKGEVVSVIDTGRVLAFCQTEFGYLAAFETNWRLSPLHLFGDGPINLENLEIPTHNHTSSNEARLQLYGWEMETLDDKTLPGHNEPTLLIHKCNVVCVSGFYRHVISVFFLKNGTISHLKDISIGLEYRLAGLNFRENDLLVLKRRFDSDNILLTFPSKSGSISGNVFLDRVKLEEHIGDIMGPKKKKKQNICRDKKGRNDISVLLPKFIDHNNITDEDVKRRAVQIIDQYKEKPPSIDSFSDSELSEGTLEILADCRPRHPFVPIPVSDSSDEESSELQMPGKLILPANKIMGNTAFNLISELNSATLPIERKSVGQKNEAKNGCSSKGADSSNINEKLDRIVTLLERQNSLLEMIARQSLVNK